MLGHIVFSGLLSALSAEDGAGTKIKKKLEYTQDVNKIIFYK
jgi:hypothetical protein